MCWGNVGTTVTSLFLGEKPADGVICRVMSWTLQAQIKGRDSKGHLYVQLISKCCRQL